MHLPFVNKVVFAEYFIWACDICFVKGAY